ncbi:MAG TPA: wax ester/triacylglycerol synthase family O-acyltransferase [Marmoricola sp.]|nr:wax ester/triacylglycerol synthase family O-acyltransferase [Marmoricola sp.]
MSTRTVKHPARHRMGAADAAWLRMDRPTNLMVVTSVMWFEGEIDLDDLRAVYESRVFDRFPRFTQRVVRDHGLWWEDVPGFRFEDHVREVLLPKPAGKAELEEFVGAQVGVPLDPEKPLWLLHVVENFEGGTALVYRMHHAIADGFALVRVLLSLTDSDAREEATLAPPADHGRLDAGSVSAALSGTAHAAFETLLHPQRLLGLADPRAALHAASEAADDTAAAGKLLLLPPDRHTALRGKVGVPKSTAWSGPLSLQRIKDVGHANAASVNDVLLAAVAGGLRTWLVRQRSEVHDLRAIVPFNLRPLNEPLPADLGNRFGLVYLDLPVTVANRADRLAEMTRRMGAIKGSAEGPVSYGILQLIGSVPGSVEQLAIDVFASKGSAVMTNVPGPRAPVTLAGRRLLGTIGWGPTSGGLSLGVAIFSYAGEVTVGFCADAALVPDVHLMLADFEAELDALLR